MKKVLLILALIVVIAGASVWFVLNRSGVSDGAALVPADSALFVAVPDVHRTGQRWEQTALAQIGADPQVNAFLEKPLAALSSDGGAEALDILMKLKPARFFLAVPVLQSDRVGIVAGFEYFGGKPDLDAAMARLHEELLRNFPDAAKQISDYHGDEITAIALGQTTVFSASHERWGLLSNDEETLKQSLDRASGRVKEASLAASAKYRDILAKLPPQPDFAWFAQPGPLIGVLEEFGELEGAKLSPAQTAELRRIEGLGGALILDGANQKEIVFVKMDAAPEAGAIDHSGIRFTTQDTILYFEGAQNWSPIASDEYFQSLPPGIQDALTGAGIDLKTLPDIFGADGSLIVDWPAAAMMPTALMALEVKDSAKAEALVERAVSAFAPGAVVSEIGGSRVFGLTQLKIQLIDPAVAVGDGHLFASLTTPVLERALTPNSGGTTLQDTPAFQAAMPAWKTDAVGFGYVDTRVLFERIYNSLRPVIIFGATMVPGVTAVIDIDKLPETDAVSRHLGPIVYTQRAVPEGWIIESTGPVTLYQACSLVGLGVGASAFSQMMSGGN